MENVIGLVDALAWPTLVFFLIVWLRKPLQNMLQLIHKVRYRDIEINFSKNIARIQDNMGDVLSEKQDLIIGRRDLYELVEVSPASLVIEAWNALEIYARERVEKLLPANESFKDPLRRPIEYLDYKGALPRETFSVIRDLSDLRNQANHARNREISRQDALQYAKIATNVWKQIDAITDLPKVKLSAFTLLILQINCLIDSGNFNDITIEEVYDWIEGKKVIPALSERAKGKIDLSLYGVDGPYANFSEFYHDQMHSLMGGYAGQHRRKWDVENLGLCLLLAWTNELIQQGSGWYPSEM